MTVDFPHSAPGGLSFFPYSEGNFFPGGRPNGTFFPRAKARSVIKEVEQFFHSDWFTWLTSLDGEMLLERLKKETSV